MEQRVEFRMTARTRGQMQSIQLQLTLEDMAVLAHAFECYANTCAESMEDAARRGILPTHMAVIVASAGTLTRELQKWCCAAATMTADSAGAAEPPQDAASASCAKAQSATQQPSGGDSPDGWSALEGARIAACLRDIAMMTPSQMALITTPDGDPIGTVQGLLQWVADGFDSCAEGGSC